MRANGSISSSAACRPGRDCRFTLNDDLRALAGGRVRGRTFFAFSTGGPAIVRSIPREGARIEEEQPFVLVLTGPASRESVLAHAWCQVRRGLPSASRSLSSATPSATTLLAHLHLQAAAETVVVARCTQRFAPGAKVTIVWGQGIEALRDGAADRHRLARRATRALRRAAGVSRDAALRARERQRRPACRWQPCASSSRHR